MLDCREVDSELLENHVDQMIFLELTIHYVDPQLKTNVQQTFLTSKQSLLQLCTAERHSVIITKVQKLAMYTSADPCRALYTIKQHWYYIL